MYLCKVYAMFKTVYPESEIGFTMRPKSALLLKNQSMDQCKPSLHKHFPLKLETLRIGFDATFWTNVLCFSENCNSECWKEECDE